MKRGRCIVIELYSTDADGRPTGAALAAACFPVPFGSHQWATFALDGTGSWELAGDTRYAVVLSSSDTNQASFFNWCVSFSPLNWAPSIHPLGPPAHALIGRAPRCLPPTQGRLRRQVGSDLGHRVPVIRWDFELQCRPANQVVAGAPVALAAAAGRLRDSPRQVRGWAGACPGQPAAFIFRSSPATLAAPAACPTTCPHLPACSPTLAQSFTALDNT